MKFMGLFPTETDLFKCLLTCAAYKYSGFYFRSCVPDLGQLKASLRVQLPAAIRMLFWQGRLNSHTKRAPNLSGTLD